MSRFVTFRSTRFENKTPKPHFINECCFGEDLASWLRERLDPAFTPSDIIQEDYGWGFWTEVNGHPYWVCVGVMDDSIGVEDAEWGIGIAYDPGPRIWRWLFNRPAPDALMPLCHAVDAVLQTNPEFAHSIEWWHEAHEGESTPHPT